MGGNSLRLDPGVSKMTYVCAPCRRSFKHPRVAPHPAACPDCAVEAVLVSHKFKPPRRDNLRQWKKVALLLRAGFRFESVDGCYPRTLMDAREFIATRSPPSIQRAKQ